MRYESVTMVLRTNRKSKLSALCPTTIAESFAIENDENSEVRLGFMSPIASSLHWTHYWLHAFSSVSRAILREANFVRQDTIWNFIEGLCNDKPRGFFYRRNCYIAYTQTLSLKLVQRECWPVWEGVFSSKPFRIDNNISTVKGNNASGITFTEHATEAFVHCLSDGRQRSTQDLREEKSLSWNEPLFDQTPW